MQHSNSNGRRDLLQMIKEIRMGLLGVAQITKETDTHRMWKNVFFLQNSASDSFDFWKGKLLLIHQFSFVVQPILCPSGPFWTILDKNDFFAPNGQSRGWQRCFGAKYQFLFETVQKGPDGPKRVPNGQKHLGWPFWSLSDPFGPLWSVDKPAMFGPFWSKMDHF